MSTDFRFPENPEIEELVRFFLAIEDHEVRRCLLALIKEIAKSSSRWDSYLIPL